MSDTGIVLDQMNLVVRDMQATLRFYRLLGLAIPADAGEDSGGMHVEVEMPGGVHLDFDSFELARAYNRGWTEAQGGGSRGVLGFSARLAKPSTKATPRWSTPAIRDSSLPTTLSGARATPSSRIRTATTSA